MASQVLQNSNGGQYNAAVTGGTGETLILTGNGVVNRLSITAAGTASLSIYDGTQSTGGTLIFTSLTNDAVGTIKDCQFPVANGIVVKGTTGSPSVGVFYSKGNANGN